MDVHKHSIQAERLEVVGIGRRRAGRMTRSFGSYWRVWRRNVRYLRRRTRLMSSKLTIGGGSLALWALPPSIVASRHDAEHAALDLHRIVRASKISYASSGLTESHFGTPAKIVINFFRISRSRRSRSLSRCKRAISAAWSADGSVACVVGRCAAAIGRLAPRCSTAAHGTAQAKFLGHRADRAATRCGQINRLRAS
jgi:hypothetical protein